MLRLDSLVFIDFIVYIMPEEIHHLLPQGFSVCIYIYLILYNNAKLNLFNC